ncbi:hypothetical protein B484DRAFT_275274 [Ochromonadaceae sp. CCMP2298]|nr:hypothetical protein B484DRAFT_275274 [Ochromonadaceae sp. CCMP2298]
MVVLGTGSLGAGSLGTGATGAGGGTGTGLGQASALFEEPAGTSQRGRWGRWGSCWAQCCWSRSPPTAHKPCTPCACTSIEYHPHPHPLHTSGVRDDTWSGVHGGGGGGRGRVQGEGAGSTDLCDMCISHTYGTPLRKLTRTLMDGDGVTNTTLDLYYFYA